MNKKYIKKGNMKLNKKVGIFDLPTSVCKTKCPSCYAKKAELRFKSTLEARNHNLELTKNKEEFVNTINKEIKQSKIEKFRIHSSGDMYDQQYLDTWTDIIEQNPSTKFYTYTKMKEKLDFTKIAKLDNVNVINSITPIGLNYGDKEHCSKLKEIGYKLCPCEKGKHVDCMNECTDCLNNDKVCFLKH